MKKTRRPTRPSIKRRSFLKAVGGLTVAGATGALLPRRALSQSEGGREDRTRFLIVLAANGGASIIDGPLAIAASETQNAALLNTFPDAAVSAIDGAPFRAVDLTRDSLGQIPMPFTSNQSNFIKAHHKDMMVATWERTSVNHWIGQRRSITGNEAWSGRTMQELVALQHGEGFAIPNVHLSSGSGFNSPGTDRTMPGRVFGELIADPALWPLALDGARGLEHSVSRDMLERARALRDARLEPSSEFVRVFGESTKMQRWRHIRGTPQETIEANDLISKLMLFDEADGYPLERYGLSSSSGARKARERFPDYATDPLQAQAAMAFLLLRYRVAVSVTMGPSFDIDIKEGATATDGSLDEGSVRNPPIAFDFSHQEHRSIQAFMWERMYDIAGGLIALLKSEPYGEAGESLWDRTMIYVATDFGRTKNRPANTDAFATGHDLNNGVVVLSPLVAGDSVLGGVDPDTGLTYGFDPSSGEADRARVMQEREIFAGLLQALRVDTTGSGLPDMPSMRRG